MQAANHLRLAMHQRIIRYIQSKDLEPWADLHQVLHQKSLRKTNVESSISCLKIEGRNNTLGKGYPASIVGVAAIAIFAWATEIFLAIFPRSCDYRRIFGIAASLNIALHFG